jgi:hypothetical protein
VLEERGLKVVGADLGLDIRIAYYLEALGKDLDAAQNTLSQAEMDGLLFALNQRSAIVISTEN